MHFHSGTWDVTFNTTSSFVTNTNWQYYSGETTLSYFSQMVGLTVQNFLSAGVGIVVAVALIRGIIASQRQQPRQLLAGPGAHRSCGCCGPLSFVVALVLVFQGSIQNFSHYMSLSTRYRPPAADRAGPGRLAGGDQAAGDQRRRVLQHQLRAPVREPDRASRTSLEMLTGAADPGRTRVHVRPDGRQPPPGLRDLRDDDGDVPRRGDASPTSPRRTAHPPSTPPACTPR